jgi:signal transduction histidine kinase
VWVGISVVPCVVISILPFVDDKGELVELVIRNLVLCLLALAIGDIVRSRREASARQAAMLEQTALARLGDERLRIAREVHDVVAHAVVGINVQAGVAAHLLRRDPGPRRGGAARHQGRQRRRAGRPARHARRAARHRRGRPAGPGGDAQPSSTA